MVRFTQLTTTFMSNVIVHLRRTTYFLCAKSMRSTKNGKLVHTYTVIIFGHSFLANQHIFSQLNTRAMFTLMWEKDEIVYIPLSDTYSIHRQFTIVQALAWAKAICINKQYFFFTESSSFNYCWNCWLHHTDKGQTTSEGKNYVQWETIHSNRSESSSRRGSDEITKIHFYFYLTSNSIVCRRTHNKQSKKFYFFLIQILYARLSKYISTCAGNKFWAFHILSWYRLPGTQFDSKSYNKNSLSFRNKFLFNISIPISHCWHLQRNVWLDRVAWNSLMGFFFW